MRQRPTSDILGSHLLATIERQRRIICDLLIKNQALRARLMHTDSSTDEPPGRESLKRRVAGTGQIARWGETRVR